MVTLDRGGDHRRRRGRQNPGDKIFPYIQKNIDDILTIEDGELVDAFLDMMEKHKMIVENAGLLPIAALAHLDCQGKNVVPVLSGGNMDVITVASLVPARPDQPGRVFTFSVQLPDRPGELVRVAQLVAEANGNIIKLEHNQFVNINRQTGVELRVTLEAFGHSPQAGPFWTPCAARAMTATGCHQRTSTTEPAPGAARAGTTGVVRGPPRIAYMKRRFLRAWAASGAAVGAGRARQRGPAAASAWCILCRPRLRCPPPVEPMGYPTTEF